MTDSKSGIVARGVLILRIPRPSSVGVTLENRKSRLLKIAGRVFVCLWSGVPTADSAISSREARSLALNSWTDPISFLQSSWARLRANLPLLESLKSLLSGIVVNSYSGIAVGFFFFFFQMLQ